MVVRNELEQYLQGFLNTGSYHDYAPNGLQVEGKDTITRLCTAVTASLEVVHQAAQWGADALLVHHGYFWRGEEAVIVGTKKQRIEALLNHQINLFGYHLPLDCHQELGNNACLGRLFALNEVKTHKVGAVEHLLWSGVLGKTLTIEEFSELIANKLGRPPLHIHAGSQSIKSVAWCSGGAQDYITEAHRLGVDAYLSGEVSERTYYQAKELGIHYYGCGHHATERYGVQALGRHLAQQFQLEHLFLDSANPV